MTTETPTTATSETLTSKWFITFKEHPCGHTHTQYQGSVEAQLTDTVYLVNFYSWFTGGFGSQELMTIDQFIEGETKFYDNGEDLQYDYEYFVSHRDKHHDKCETTA